MKKRRRDYFWGGIAALLVIGFFDKSIPPYWWGTACLAVALVWRLETSIYFAVDLLGVIFGKLPASALDVSNEDDRRKIAERAEKFQTSGT